MSLSESKKKQIKIFLTIIYFGLAFFLFFLMTLNK